MKKRIILLLLAVTTCSGTIMSSKIDYASSGDDSKVLTLDSCRSYALRNNKELQMTALKIDVAHQNRKSAFTKYLPHVDVAGTYAFSSREVSLLNDDQKSALGNLGQTVGGLISQFQELGPVLQPTLQGAIQNYLATLPAEYRLAAAQQIQQKMAGMQSTMGNLPAAAQGLGNNLLDAFHTDTRNMGLISAMFTQPLYMGGKIMAYNKITKYAEELAKSKHALEEQNVIVSVDETYWNIVQLSSKKKLAQSYLDLLKKLDGDVEHLVTEGFATKADALSVKVKVNEAEVTMIQIDNGLSLLKMLLAQQCGMEDYDFVLADENKDTFDLPVTSESSSTDALAQRPEMHQLQLANDIYREKVKIARSEFMPTVALTGGYVTTNPSVFNGFENKFGGMWTVGVGVKVPVLTWGDRLFKVRAAKSEAKIQELQTAEVSEKITLQVKQCQQKLQEAGERMAVANKSKAAAEENLRVAEYGMKEGVIPVSNVLQAQTAWLSANSTFVSSQIDMMLADLYLRKAMGKVY